MHTWFERGTSEQVRRAAQAQLDKFRAEATKENPGVPEAIALQEIATERGAAKLATQSGEQRIETAAEMYYGYLALNTIARPAFCREQGIAIPAWTVAFETANASETARAREIFAKTGLSENHLYELFADQFKEFVALDMNQIASDNKVPIRDACKLLQDHADEFVAIMRLDKSEPAVYKALMTP